MTPREFIHRSQRQSHARGWLRFSKRSQAAKGLNASRAQLSFFPSQRRPLSPLRASVCACRPSAGGRLATCSPRMRSTTQDGPAALATLRQLIKVSGASTWRQAVKPRRLSSSPRPEHRAPRVRPNPSIERTRNSRPRYAASSLSAPRGLLLRSAHVKR